MIQINREPAGHWYSKEGKPVHTQTKKDGGERNTTLADAKKLGLYPSVTTVMKIIAKPELENWKQEQAILSALTLPRMEGESEADFAKRVVQDSGETAKKAADFGTTIHNIIDNYYSGSAINEHYKVMLDEIDKIFHTHGLTPYRMEEVIVGDGFAGKFDMMAKDKDGKIWVIDFKTQDFKIKPNVYDEWLWQLGAYSLDKSVKDNIAGGLNIVIKKSDTNIVSSVVYDFVQIRFGRMMFEDIFRIWKNIKGYNPE